MDLRVIDQVRASAQLRLWFSKERPTSLSATLISTLDLRMKRHAPAWPREAVLWFRRIRPRKCAPRMLPPLKSDQTRQMAPYGEARWTNWLHNGSANERE
jgi:hypothetical protein